MAIRDILRYPHPTLRQPSREVAEVDDAARRVAADLVDTLYANAGAVGLAAPQIGVSLRIIAVDVSASGARDALRVLINPVVVEASRKKLGREGCLSFPTYLANIRRPTRVTVEALGLQGETQRIAARGLEAIALQHEIDHLDGVLLLDRISSLKTDLIRRRGGPGAQEGEDEG